MKKTLTELLGGPWVGLSVAVLMSPAMHDLSGSAWRVLRLLLLEWKKNHGAEPLKCPYIHCKEQGIGPAPAASAFRELKDRGLIVETLKGSGGKGKGNIPSEYRVTFLPSGDNPPTNEWKTFGAGATAAPAPAIHEAENPFG